MIMMQSPLLVSPHVYFMSVSWCWNSRSSTIWGADLDPFDKMEHSQGRLLHGWSELISPMIFMDCSFAPQSFPRMDCIVQLQSADIHCMAKGHADMHQKWSCWPASVLFDTPGPSQAAWKWWTICLCVVVEKIWIWFQTLLLETCLARCFCKATES